MVSALVLGWTFAIVAAEPDAVKPPDLAAYQAAKAKAGRDADAHVALALWCEAHGMPAEKSKHLARAVLIEPSNAKARGLLGYVQHDGRWMRPDEVSKAVEESPESRALFREYTGRRTQARDRADDQYKLAKWCDDHGLTQQATAHYHRVIQLDPGRDLAWKHLGFTKTSGRWVKPEALAAQRLEREAQAKADKVWKPRLEKLKEALSGRDKAKKAEAQEALAAIDDPRAAPMAWRVFVQSDERWQAVALQVFSQIDAPVSSSSLAMLAVFSPRPEIRSVASQVLTRRDARDFAGLLIGLLEDEVKYKVTSVGGPGSPGQLFIQGKDTNVDRRYTPFTYPTLQPGDVVHYDAGGTPYATRVMTASSSRFAWYPGNLAPTSTVYSAAPGVGVLTPSLERAGLTSQQSQQLVQQISTQTGAHGSSTAGAGSTGHAGGAGGAGLIMVQNIPIGQMMAEARLSALIAQQQLERDVRWIDSYNTPVREINGRIQGILKAVRGEDAGAEGGTEAERESWMKWFADLQGYAFRTSPADPTPPPTIFEEVPIEAPRQAVATVSTQTAVACKSPPPPKMPSYGHHCLAAGTQIHTFRGSRPIEELRAGDQVLTQDAASGKLEYHPIVTAYHNPPNETYRLDLGTESIVATGIHRFWKAGHGWIMARELKAGDRLRTLGGAVEVVAVTKDRVQPVFNLRLDGGDDFCVGALGVIAHDNSFVEPVEHPFDGVPTLADLGPSTKP